MFELDFQELSNELKSAEGKLHSFKCDVSDQLSVKNAFEWIEQKFGGVDILINNAGIFKYDEFCKTLNF